MKFDEVFTYNHLYDAYWKSLKGVRWKGTVQNYSFHSISNLYLSLEEIRKELFDSGHFFKFPLMERGKLRHIQSVGIKERVIQRCLCDYCLVPTLSKLFIYDNMACIKGKGVHVALNRMKQQLRKYYRKHHNSNDGYILQFDFHHYFDTIPHDKIIAKISEHIDDPKLMRLISQLVNDFDGDKGLGLGSQISQISALFYPNDIDHFFIKYEGVEGYGRYMDDGYLISSDKEVLKRCAAILEEMVKELGIELNTNKTQISKFSHGFVFLKARFFLTDTGKVIMKPNRKNITRNRRKLKKLFKLGKSLDIIENFVQTTTGNLKHFHAYHTIKNFKKLYQEELKKMVKSQHPYIDENGNQREDLIKFYSDEGCQLMQTETGLVFDDVIDRYPSKYHYVEVKDMVDQPAEA